MVQKGLGQTLPWAKGQKSQMPKRAKGKKGQESKGPRANDQRVNGPRDWENAKRAPLGQMGQLGKSGSNVPKC